MGKKASTPNVKLQPEVDRLLDLVGAHQNKGKAALANAILKETLESMWDAIQDEIALARQPKKKWH